MQTIKYTQDDLMQVCIRLTEEVNARAGQVARNISGVMELAKPEERDAVDTMKRLGTKYPALEGYYPKPKKLLVSGMLSWQGLTGVYSPFTVEANYNKDMTAYNVPFIACHELSH